MEGLQQLMTAVGERPLLAFALTMARIAPLFLLAPLFSNKQFPLRARGVCAVALAVGLTPLAAKGATVPDDPFTLAGIVGKELLVGAATSSAPAAIPTNACWTPSTSGPSAGASVSGTSSYVRARPCSSQASPPMATKISVATSP